MSCDWECDKGVTQIQTEALFVVGKVSEVQAIKAHPSSLFIYFTKLLPILAFILHLSKKYRNKLTQNKCTYFTVNVTFITSPAKYTFMHLI